ncbi:MAG: alpha-D-ribose 1-methylphosphonate 5-triphosphate diphosphatase [Pseudomonadota bacterium]
MTQDFTLANATLVLADRTLIGSVTVAGGEFIEIREGDHVSAGEIDCARDYVAPGLIELHTDNLERHIQPRPKVTWPHDAAILAHDAELASTGITTVFDAMRVGSIPSGRGRYLKYAREVSRELWDLREQDALKISHFLHLRAEVCSETLEEEMAEFDASDRVRIVSLMDHTPGQRQFRDLSKLKSYYKGKHNLTDGEFVTLVEDLRALSARNGDHHASLSVKEAKRYGAVLASHDDTTVEQVATSKSHGVVMAEFPTTAEAARASHDQGIEVIMGAPNLIRGGSHSGNVAASELAQSGHLDILSSDYIPSALLLAAVKLGRDWDDMARGIATVSRNPARASGLQDRGEIALGKRADLIRFGLRADTPSLRGVWSQGARVA